MEPQARMFAALSEFSGGSGVRLEGMQICLRKGIEQTPCIFTVVRSDLKNGTRF